MNSEWKATERYVAAALGGTRVPITGRATGDAPDVEHPDFAIEVKRRSSDYAFPQWLEKAFLQARASSETVYERTGNIKTPLVVIEHAQGRGKPKRHYVMIALNDFVEIVEKERD
jgi:hypothetical protein